MKELDGSIKIGDDPILALNYISEIEGMITKCDTLKSAIRDSKYETSKEDHRTANPVNGSRRGIFHAEYFRKF